jgi:hypothetical protein
VLILIVGILVQGERAGAPLHAAANGAREHALVLTMTTCYLPPT